MDSTYLDLADWRRRVAEMYAAWRHEAESDPERATQMGAAGREHVRRQFLSTRELEDWLRLYTEIIPLPSTLLPTA